MQWFIPAWKSHCLEWFRLNRPNGFQHLSNRHIHTKCTAYPRYVGTCPRGTKLATLQQYMHSPSHDTSSHICEAPPPLRENSSLSLCLSHNFASLHICRRRAFDCTNSRAYQLWKMCQCCYIDQLLLHASNFFFFNLRGDRMG